MSYTTSAISPYEPDGTACDNLSLMTSGHLYDSSDPRLCDMRARAADLCERLNSTPRIRARERGDILSSLFPGHGADLDITGPLHVDYGVNTSLGERVYANYNLTILDCAEVTIGDDVMIGPNTSILTAMHPMRWQDRDARTSPDGHLHNYEYALPITIGPHCWIGGCATILGGVTIGAGCVIGAGAVVTRNIPDNSVAVGNPARVSRSIDNHDAACFQNYA
ncbi:sugar O-acetyltransferase [uncultured Bifidobacterium sp.]|uniref:sugar O-acetyltransferase n=1 Tax=uncultured Bifidobacterium sp. TaxID=165187 RepID=UPI00263189B5|nr:sugar O-acetyltransferase [uncultured Bifidobacterium sp.]